MQLARLDTTAGSPPVGVIPIEPEVFYHKKVMVTLPWWKQVSPVTAFCVSQIIDRRRTATILSYGDAFVAHSRNTCADIFLQSPCDWMLTIDDDMVVPFGHAGWFKSNSGFEDFPEKFLSLNALDRLMSHKKTLVGALYFGRQPESLPVYNEGAANPQEAAFARKAPHDLVKPTRWVGTGCMLIHRSVFEDIEKRFPGLARGLDHKHGNWFTSTEASLLQDVTALRDALQGKPLTGELAYSSLAGLDAAVARARQENSLGYGEDVSFCLRAAAAGHQPHVDMGLVCGHLGSFCYGPRNRMPAPALISK